MGRNSTVSGCTIHAEVTPLTDDEKAPFLATAAEGKWFLYSTAVFLAVAAIGVWWMPNDSSQTELYNFIFRLIVTFGGGALSISSFQSARDDGSDKIDWFVNNHAKVVWIHPTQHSLNGAVVSTWYELRTNDGTMFELILMTANVPTGEAVMRKYCPDAVWGVHSDLMTAWLNDPASLPGDHR